MPMLGKAEDRVWEFSLRTPGLRFPSEWTRQKTPQLAGVPRLAYQAGLHGNDRLRSSGAKWQTFLSSLGLALPASSCLSCRADSADASADQARADPGLSRLSEKQAGPTISGLVRGNAAPKRIACPFFRTLARICRSSVAVSI